MTRIESFRANLQDGIDVALITDELNIRYLSGVNYSDGFLLITREEAYLFADSRYIEVARKKAADGFTVMLLSGRRSDLIKPLIEKGSTVGYEENSMTAGTLEGYKAAMRGYPFKPLGMITERLRNVKDEAEKGFVVKAQRIAEKAFILAGELLLALVPYGKAGRGGAHVFRQHETTGLVQLEMLVILERAQ